MKLYLLTQGIETGYDTYNGVVVAAESEEDAREIHPSEHETEERWKTTCSGTWPRYDQRHLIDVEYLGKTDQPRGVILASFYGT